MKFYKYIYTPFSFFFTYYELSLLKKFAFKAINRMLVMNFLLYKHTYTHTYININSHQVCLVIKLLKTINK